jgi:hypothetical protein
MARDNGMAQMHRLALLHVLDGTRPSGALEWVSPVVPAVTQAAVGAGHWAAGRRRRALAAWAGAAGFALVAWGLGTEAPTRAEAEQNIEQQKDRLRELGLQVPATAGTQTPLSQRSLHALDALVTSARLTFDVRSGLRRPRRLALRAIADETPAAVFYALRAARAGQQRRPRIAAGSVLVVAGSAARLRAASAEPLP